MLDSSPAGRTVARSPLAPEQTMNRTLVALLAIAACAPAQQGQTDADYAAIAAAENEFAAGMNAGDMAKVAAIYSDDAVLMPPNLPAVHGRLAIQEFLATFPPVGDFKLMAGETKGGAGLVTVRGQYSMNLMPPGASAAVADSGKFIEVWLQQPDGAWRLAWDIWNSNIALAPPPPAK
jgi:ketosteroid isomerase-like protein